MANKRKIEGKNRQAAAEKKRVSGTALPWFNSFYLTRVEQKGLSDIEQGCLALERNGMPCPMTTSSEKWVRENFAYICARYKEVYPQPIKHNKPTKAVKVAAKALRNSANPRMARVKTLPANNSVMQDSFLSTYEWRKVRMQALKKYGPRCQCCGATPADGAVMNVDHIKPRKLRPDLALDVANLQVLCHECNHGKGNWDQTDWRKP